MGAGTITSRLGALQLAAFANCSAPRREVMVPAPMLSLPGLALALAISSLIVLGPSLRTTTSATVLISNVIGAKSFSGSYGRLGVTNGLSTMVVSIAANSV